MPALPMEGAEPCPYSLSAQRPALARQVSSSFLILLLKLEAQLDMPKHRQHGAGPQQLHRVQGTPSLEEQDWGASWQQKASIFSLLFPVGSTPASAAKPTHLL